MRLAVAYFFKTTFITPPETKEIKLMIGLTLTPYQNKLMQDTGVIYKRPTAPQSPSSRIYTLMTNSFIVSTTYISNCQAVSGSWCMEACKCSTSVQVMNNCSFVI